MKICLAGVIIIMLIMFGDRDAAAGAGTGAPLKYISSCEIDLNNDNNPDLAILAETLLGREIIVLIRHPAGYNAYQISAKVNMILSCHHGKAVTETQAGKGKRSSVVHNTPGAYIKMTLPEGSAVVYFLSGNGFKEVWTSD